MRRVEAQIADQRFCKAFHGKLRSRIGGVRDAGADAGPEAVDAACVGDVGAVGFHQHRQKHTAAEIDAVPAYIEGAVPFLARASDKAAATADTGIVEQEMDAIRFQFIFDRLAEAFQRLFAADIGDMCQNARALWQACRFGLTFGLGHVGGVHVAHRDRAAFCGELFYHLAAHARAAACDDRNPSCKLHHNPRFKITAASG
jgi:hypothetical protein